MGRAKTQFERNAFVRGLITEASPLTFPENASLDEKNFVLNRNGSRQRRLGIDTESGGSYKNTAFTDTAYKGLAVRTFKWDNVANDPTLSFGVIQVGDKLWFVDLFKDTLSTNFKNSGNAYSLGTVGSTLCDFASIDGKLIVASKELDDPIYLSYDKTADSFSQSSIDIKVRDIWGVDDSLQVDEHPATLSDEHEYNLLNQGWTDDTITDYFTAESEYPSNADIVFFGKKTDGTFDSTLITGSYVGTTPAAKGKYIIDAFDRGSDRDAKSGIVGLPADTDSGNISTVASYAGRIFYSGVESTPSGTDALSPNYAGTIFYSQTIESEIQLSRCYQDADPTSEDISDLVATDGGTIKIAEAGQIIKLIPKDASLVVIADNGVWEITGPDNVFKATEYSINKVTNIGCISQESVINAEGTLMYWADSGIYVLASDQVSGRLTAQNITERTIQTFYEAIPSVGRANCKGNFDAIARKISWLYNDEDGYDGIEYKYRYNKELIFDVVLQAFYVYEINALETDSPYVSGYMPTQVFNTLAYNNSVIHNGTAVLANTNPVVIGEQARSRGTSQTKYLTTKYDSGTATHDMIFSSYVNADFMDWGSVDADAYLITGYELFQDTQRQKGVNYLTMHFQRTEETLTDVGGTLIPDNPSECWVQAQWEFADSEAAMKYGSEFQAYRLKSRYYPTVEGDFDYGLSVITTKNKLRGSGRTISLKMRTSEGNDCYILGWGVDVDGQTVV